MKFERFRAYTLGEATTSKWVEHEDDEGRVTKTRDVIDAWPAEHVAFEGASSGDGETAEFNAGNTEISKVVFYRGDVESERVVGSVEVGKAGKISVKCPDRVKPEA